MGNRNEPISIYSRSRISDICEYAFRHQRTGEQLTHEALGKMIGRSARWVSDVINGRTIPMREDAEDFVRACGNHRAIRMLKHLYGDAPPPTDPRLMVNLTTALYNLIKQCQDVIAEAERVIEWERRRRPWQSLSTADEQLLKHLGKQIEDLFQAGDDVHIIMDEKYGIDPAIHQHNWLAEARALEIVVSDPRELMRRERQEALLTGETSL
ncbi:helix-turn-helix domain-containing protein [Brevibacillus sp. SYP-B805]|uniref:helix-turn-helix domain-containing protein n=1 Tax=Brevibacillus sp. SYP-B805 TaxID=1578199 RepID=UPI0013E9B3C8|nr:helix-turn-helix transcriptional regulator [Brevibacillus sp. SYP-B805]NGQ95049.1 helix-turn-helix domain-containing protein [Brevibacillus sp. SYP-B805]